MMSKDSKSLFASGEIWMSFAAVAFALSNIFDRVAMAGVETDPILGAAIKTIPYIIVAAILILCGLDQRQFGDTADNPKPGAYNYFVISGFVGEFVGGICFLQAMKFGGVNVAVPTVQVWTLIAAMIGVFWLKEDFHKNIFIGLACVVGGLVVLSVGQFTGMPVSPRWYLGLAFGLLAACCWAISTACFTKGQQMGAARFKGMVRQYLSALIFSLVFLLFVGRIRLVWMTPANFYYSLFVAASFSVVAMIFLYTAVRLSPMSKVIPINASYPALAAVLAAIFLKEHLNIVTFLGIVLVGVGVVVSQRRPKQGEA